MHATTILALRHKGAMVIAGDGQVTHQQQVLKHHARKVRRLHHDKIIVGFAGATADALTLFDRLEQKLQEFNGHLARAAVALAKDWRTERALRKLDALLLAADREQIFLISGTGDVIEPDSDVIGIGSGGAIAQAAATALMQHSELDAAQIAREALRITAKLCIYTNEQVLLEVLE